MIDIVIPWVDGSDPKWQAEFRSFKDEMAGGTPSPGSGKSDSAIEKSLPDEPVVAIGGDENTAEIRYRDWDTLRFVLRGIERFAPWVRYVHLVTCGHLPEWLDVTCPKLNVVRHEDFIPAQYLPTFASRPIELNVHRISGLADRFILFNDDMFFLRPVPEERFFRVGQPCDMARLSLIAPSTISHTVLNMIEILGRRHSRREVMRRNFWKWWSPRYGASNLLKTMSLTVWQGWAGLTDTHMPQPYKKSIFERLWAEENAILDATCRQKFRSPMGVNHWLMRYEQLATGQFAPIAQSDTRLDYLAEERIGEIESYIRSQKYAMICLNDSILAQNFEVLRARLTAAFESILPNKSSFEL